MGGMKSGGLLLKNKGRKSPAITRSAPRHDRRDEVVGAGPATRDRRYVLRLFIAGATARSQAAVRGVRILCAGALKGRCTLEVIDIFQQPALARANLIVVTPTLLIALPLPVRRLMGSLNTFTDPLGLFNAVESGGVAP
jgi:circadian clock protein KaiB